MKRFLPKLKNNPSGFTLIELLIVIAIIAVLATIGFAVYSNLGTGPKTRNERRRADLDAIAKALEVNRDPVTGYKVLSATQFVNNAIPTDPTATYVYCANSTASSQPGDPAAWTTACPVNYGTVGTTNPPAGTVWKVCASLEAETNPTVAAQVVCKLSAQ